jgi:hypothetical protein
MSPGRVFALPPRPREPERPRRQGDPGPERRLAELGLELPALRPKAGRYEGWVLAGDLLFLSGQGPTAGPAGSASTSPSSRAGRPPTTAP